MTQQEKDVKQYLSEIEKLLFGPKKEQKRFLAEYEETIYESIEETGQTYSYKQLVHRFGAPALVAEHYASAFATEAKKAKAKINRRKHIIAAVCILAVLFCLLSLVFTMQNSAAHYSDDYFTDGAWRCS